MPLTRGVRKSVRKAKRRLRMRNRHPVTRPGWKRPPSSARLLLSEWPGEDAVVRQQGRLGSELRVHNAQLREERQDRSGGLRWILGEIEIRVGELKNGDRLRRV